MFFFFEDKSHLSNFSCRLVSFMKADTPKIKTVPRFSLSASNYPFGNFLSFKTESNQFLPRFN